MQNRLAVNSVDGNSMSESVTLINNILQSNNYVEGYAGWRITGNGKAEFENVSVRGNIEAYSGSIGYWNISTPAVTRVIGSTSLLGTFLESTGIGSDDQDETEGSYVALFKSYVPNAVVVTTKVRTSNVATLTAVDHEYVVGDKVIITLEDDTSFNNSGIAVTITTTTIDTFSYTNVGNNVASSDALGEAQLYNKDVAGLYLQDYSKALFDHGYFSNEGIKYVSAEAYNLVHNPSFEYIVSNTSTYSNTGWAFDANLVATSFSTGSLVTISEGEDSSQHELFRDDSVYTAYSTKLTWGTNSLSNSYASINVNYSLLHGLADLQKTLYFDFYAYFNPAGAAITATNIQRTNGSANVVVTAASHGLSTGEYIWNDVFGTTNVNQNIDAYVPLKIVTANTNTFTVTVGTAATSNANITPLVQDRLYRFHPAAYKLTDIRFKLPNANTINLYEVLADDTKATWDANTAYTLFSLPYKKNSTNGYALSSRGVYDDTNSLVIYNLPKLAPISSTEGTAVPYEIKINASEIARLYAIRDNTGFTNKNNIQLQFPGWIYRNEATPATKITAYANTAIYLDNISLSTEKSFFYGGADIASQSWYVDADRPNTASVLSAKTWIDIDLETQTSYLNHTDYVSFNSPLLRDKLVKNSGIYTVNDVDNIDYKPISIETSIVSDYSSLLFTSGEYEYKLVDNTYANYEALVSSRVEKNKAFLYLSTLYKNLDADGTYSAADLNKWEASITMASGANQNTEIDITAASIRMHAPAYYDTDTYTWYPGIGDTFLTVVGDAYMTGNGSTGLDFTVGNDLFVLNVAYIGTQILSSDSTTNFATRKYTDTVTSLPTGTWYTIAYNPGGSNLVSVGRATAQFVLVDRQAGKHQSVHFMASATFGDPGLTILHSSAFSSGGPFEAIRVKTGSTYDGAVLQVYSNGSSSAVNAQAFMYANDQTPGGWELVDFIDDVEDPSTYGTTAMTNYANLVAKSEFNLKLGGGIGQNKLMVDGGLVVSNSTTSSVYTMIQSNTASFYGNVSVGNSLTVTGNLIVNGTTTTINSTTLSIDDKNIVLGNVAGSSNTTANGGGITLEATTGGDKTINWLSATQAWTSSEDFNLLSGKVYKINGSTVLSSTQILGYGISDANGASTIVARNSSGNFAANTITASLTGTASLATSLAGGATGGIPYQTAVNTSAFLAATATNNQVLSYNTATGAPQWTAITGTGNVVYSTNAVLTTPNIGTPSFANLTSATALPISTGVAGLGTGVATALAVNTETAGAFVVNGGALGTPSSANLSSATGLPVSTGISGLGTGVATFLATPNSLNLIGAVTDETGTGNLVFSTSPTLVTPTLGVASATSLNKVTVTAPATAATLTLADGSTLTTSGAFTTTITATANTAVTLPTSGTLATEAFVGSATVAQANNLTGTTPNLIPYQSASNTTTFLAAPAGNNYVLSANTTGAPFWKTITGTGNVVFDTSATLITPNISGTLRFDGNASNSVSFAVTGSDSNQGNLVINSGTTQIFGTLPAAPTFTVRGATSQSANLQVWENVGGTDLAYMDKDGNLTANSFAGSGASLTSLNGSNVTSGLVGLAYGGTGSNTAPKAMTALMGYTSTATAAGTTTLNNTSSYYQQFTGTTTQTVQLPDTSTLAQGWTFHVVNNSTGLVTVRTSTSATVIIIPSGTTAMVTCIDITVNTAAAWEFGLTDFSTYTGSGAVVMNTSPTLVTPNIGTPSFANLTNGTSYPVANLANLATNVATFLTTPSSANLRNAVTDEAGTGALVFRASTAAATSDIAIGWYTIAYIPANRGSAKFIVTDTRAGRHQVVVFQATALYDIDAAAGITVLHQSAYSLANAPIQKIRIKNGNVSSDGAVLQVYIDNAQNTLTAYMYENDIPSSWSLPTNWVDDATDPGVAVYANLAAVTEVNLDSGSAGRNQMLVTGDIYAGINAASHVLASQAYSMASNTSYTLVTNNTNQSLFPALANGVAVESGFRYEIEGTFVVSHTVTTITNGTVSDVLSTSFNVPTLAYGWMEYGYATSTTATFAAGTTDTITGDVVTTTLTNDAIANSISRSTTGTTSGYIYIRFRGVVKTSAAGNILPRVKFNYTDAGGVGSNSGIIQAGSWMRVTKVSESTGAWT
jgi:hypothetical protein